MADAVTPTVKKTIAIPSAVVIKDLAALLSMPVNTIMAELIKNGIMSSMNERIDFETAAVIGEDLGFAVTLKQETEADRQKTINEELSELLGKDDKEHSNTRPPVVVVMGHVDHGKTKLLDAIRSTNVVAGEAGGITQHIGAYQVEKKGRLITFIDTPGHEAFSAMRSRGAHVADLAILVVAADDGIKPQTEEAIKIIQHADLPFLVAINKIDKPEINLERVKKQLADRDLLPEDWGGKVVTVPVSALTGKGIDELLDTVLLVADLEPDALRADPNRPAVGSIIEARIDKGEGPVATILVRTGTLKRGDDVKIGGIVGRVKALKDWRGKAVTKAEPSMPAKMLGLKVAPEVGDILQVVDAKEAKLLRRDQKQVSERSKTRVVYTTKKAEQERPSIPASRPMLNIVLRCDNLGSQEAIMESLQKYETAAVGVEVVAKGLGSITDADVLRADTAKGLLLGFHVVPTPRAADVAKSKQMTIGTFTVIYDLLDEIQKQAEALLPTEHIETMLGHLRVLAIFRKEKKGMIVGGRVTDGSVKNGAHVRVTRNGAVVAEGGINDLQSDKRRVPEVAMGSECGIRFEGQPVIEESDVLEVVAIEDRRADLFLA